MVVVPPRVRVLALGVTLALLAGLVACTSDEPAAAPVRTTAEQIWTTAGLEPVSAVRNVGGVAMVYGTTPGGLVLYGLDPATGTQLWAKPAAMPTADATSVRVREIAGSVAYFRPTETPRMNQLVLADPRTGVDRTVSTARYWSVHRPDCESDQSFACLNSWVNTPYGWSSQTFRVDLTSGMSAPIRGSTVKSPDDGAPLINDLYYTLPDNAVDATDANTEDGEMTIGRWVDGASAWTKRATEMFSPALPQPRQVWIWNPRGSDYAFITAVGSGIGGVSPTVDLTKDIATNAYSLSDGSTRWKREGAWLGCGGDPFVDPSSESDDGVTEEYICQYTGSGVAASKISDESQLTTTNLTVQLERIDPATGEVRWSSALGDAKTLAGDTSGALGSALLDDHHLFEPNSAGGLVVDLETGETRQPLAEESFWCEAHGAFPLTTPHFDDSVPVTVGAKKGIVRPCRSTGEDAPLPNARIPSDVAASFDGDIQAVAVVGSVTGFQVPPLPSGDDEPDAVASASSTASPSGPGSALSSAPAVIPAPATETPGSIEQVWATSGFEAKTSPTMIGGTAVLYGAVGDDLYLIGLDPATGAERWRRPASASAFPPSTEVKVVKVGDFVAYLRPAEDDQLSQIVLIDPFSGVDQVASGLMEWSTLPEVCDDDHSYVCASAYDRSSGEETIPSRHFRMDRATGATTLVPEESENAPEYTRLYNDFVQVNGAPVETVGIVKNGALVWSRPLADIAGAGATLDHGWYANDEHGEIPISYLSVTVGWAEADGKFPPLDLAANLVTVGVNSTDGSVVWSQPGTWIGCRDGLPARSEMSTPGSWSPALWCRYTGRLDSSPPGHDYRLTTPSDLTVSLERVNVQTGQPVWSVPLGAERSVAVDSNGVRVGLLDDHRLLIGGRVLDVIDGSIRPPAVADTFWCPRSQSFTQSVPWNSTDGSVHYDRRIEGEFFLCGGGGNAISGLPTAIPRAASSGTDDRLWFVSTPDGVVAYRVTE